MKMSKLDRLGIEVSKLGFGCMRLPMKGDAIDREQALAMFDYAYQHGVNYYDTAWPYLGGTSEPFVGEALSRYPRDSFFLASKMPVWLVESEADFERILEEQLVRLKTDHIDFYLLHALSKARFDKVLEQGLYDLCRKKQQEGKIRYIGFSYHDPAERFPAIVDRYPWDFAQIQYNYIDPHLLGADQLYQTLESRGIPCVVMEPVRGGFLSTLPEEFNAIFREYDPDRSPASWALKWVASHSNVKVTLSGMSSMEQMVDNIRTFEGDLTMTPAEEQVVDTVVRKILDVHTVPCTGCEYCMPCPFGVDIPEVFKAYNNFKLFRNADMTRAAYFERLKDGFRADSCKKCGKCMKACPQHIRIPDMLETAHREISEACLTK